MKFEEKIKLIATGSMENPPSGSIVLYMNTNGRIFIKDSGGTQRDLYE